MRELDKILNQNEKVFWENTPKFWPFFLQGTLTTLTIVALCFLFFSIIPSYLSEDKHFILLNPVFLISFFSVSGLMIYNLLIFKHTYYAITNKRVIIQKGWIGRDFEIIDLDQITNASVNVGFFDKMCGNGETGSIYIFSAGQPIGQSNAITRPHAILNIVNPYDVFKFLKKISHDVKTDIQYPNKLRPGDNPGYQADYDPSKK